MIILFNFVFIGVCVPNILVQTQHYLDLARVEHKDLFANMQKYYNPEKSFRREERQLHTMPSGVCMCVCVYDACM